MYLNFLTQFAAETTEKAEGISALGIDVSAFVIQLITWLLVFVVLIKYVFRPIVNVLQKRQDAIDEGIRLTSEMVEARDKLEQESEKTMRKARKEADEIISKTHEQATGIIKEAEQKAQAKVDKMIEEAKTRIDDETAKARRNLEKEIMGLVVEATEILTEEKIDNKKDSALLTKALKGKA